MSVRSRIFSKTTPPQLGRGAVTFLSLIRFCGFFVLQMRQEEGCIYSLDTITMGPPAKMASDPYLKCSDTGLPTPLGTHLYQISYDMSVTFISVT